MSARQQSTIVCQICGKEMKRNEVLPAEMVRDSISEMILKSHPDWSPASFICMSDLNTFQNKHIQEILKTKKDEFSELEEEVVKSLRDQELLSQNVNTEFTSTFTFGERVADEVARFGGSWRFLIIFGSVLLVWISINCVVLLWRPFDPYPFILLNLVLSCLAAIQAPIIMMSQNRQEAKDRVRAEHDYQVNLKAELEIRHLNQKMDMLLQHQWQRLLEIQQIQMDTIEELTQHRTGKGTK
jgi:uncharacterized membrane protein